jgi:hypothetical protein
VATMLVLQDASDEEAALKADLGHIKRAIAHVQRRIAGMPTLPLPAHAADSLDIDTLGSGKAPSAGTERSLGAIDAAMRARGYRCAASICCQVLKPRCCIACHQQLGVSISAMATASAPLIALMLLNVVRRWTPPRSGRRPAPPLQRFVSRSG